MLFENRVKIEDSKVYTNSKGEKHKSRIYHVWVSREDVEQLISLKEVFMTLKFLTEKNNGKCFAEFLHKAMDTKFKKRMESYLKIPQIRTFEDGIEINHCAFIEYRSDDKMKFIDEIENYTNRCLKTFFDYKMIERIKTERTTYYKRSAHSRRSRKRTYTATAYILTVKGKRVK